MFDRWIEEEDVGGVNARKLGMKRKWWSRASMSLFLAAC